MTPVTDPNILEQLNADMQQDSVPREKFVTDPKILAKLNGSLVPEKNTKKSLIDQINYVGDAASKGIRKGVSAPAQFLNPFLDAALGTHFTDSLSQFNAQQDASYAKRNPDAGVGADTISNLAELASPMGVGSKAFGAANYAGKGIRKLADIAGRGATSGVLSAPFTYSDSNEDPLTKTLVGGASGSVISPALYGAGKVIKPIFDPLNSVSKKILKGVNPKEALGRLEAARRLGINITPAEAGDSNMAAKAQGRLGTSEKGAEDLYRFGKKRTEQEKNVIKSLLNDISENKGIANTEIRSASKEIIGEKEKALREKARPLYEKALYLNPNEKALINPEKPNYDAAGKIHRTVSHEVFESLQQDPIISSTINKIIKNPIYKKDLNGTPPYTIKYLDYVKKYIDDLNSVAIRKGEANKSRLLTSSKNDLLSAIDSVNPEYKAAREIYGEGAKPLNTLKESDIGRVADLSDYRSRNISKIIFDPAQTDMKTFSALSKEYAEKNPTAWKKIIRNEMERRLSNVNGNYGSNFYKKMLGNENTFNQFMEATKSMPQVQSKLKDMKNVFKKLINQENVKGAYGKAKSSLDVPRSTMEALTNATKNLLGGAYDNAAIELITSGKWDKKLKSINNVKNEKIRNSKMINLLDVISASLPVVTGKQVDYFNSSFK